jgi:hypothetical protein
LTTCGLTLGFQIVSANKFRPASAEIVGKIRRLVDVLQVGLQVRRASGLKPSTLRPGSSERTHTLTPWTHAGANAARS